MRVAIVGSRLFPRLDLVEEYVQSLHSGTWVISGGAIGVDLTAEHAARRRRLPTLIFPANWEDGKSAGFRRNCLIIEQADRVVAFWDGESKGTQMSMDLAISNRIPLTIFQSDGASYDFDYQDHGIQHPLPIG